MSRFIILIFSFLLFTACQEDRPSKDLLEKDELVPLLVDLHMVYAIQSSVEFRKIALEVDSVDIYSYIFDKHGVSKVIFDSSIAWYSRHPDLFTEIYDQVIMNLTQIQDSINSGRME